MNNTIERNPVTGDFTVLCATTSVPVQAGLMPLPETKMCDTPAGLEPRYSAGHMQAYARAAIEQHVSATPGEAIEHYTCIGKGGLYKHVGVASGAGMLAGSLYHVYRDTRSGLLFTRTPMDFDTRMQQVAAPIAEAARTPVAPVSDAIPEAAAQNGGLVRAALIDLVAIEKHALNGTQIFDEYKDLVLRFACARAAINSQPGAPVAASYGLAESREAVRARAHTKGAAIGDAPASIGPPERAPVVDLHAASELPPPYGWLQFINGVKTQNFARDERELGDIQTMFRIMKNTGKAEYPGVYSEAQMRTTVRRAEELQRVYGERGLQIERLETALYRHAAAELVASNAPDEAVLDQWRGMLLALTEHIENPSNMPAVRWGVVGARFASAARKMIGHPEVASKAPSVPDWPERIRDALKGAELGMGSHVRHFDGAKLAHALQAALSDADQSGSPDAVDAGLLADLIEAADTLRRYETLHRAKGTAESTEKAEVNAELAGRFEATIAKARAKPTGADK